MYDWLRSLALLAMSFAAVTVLTIGLAGMVVPNAQGVGLEPGGGRPETSASATPSAEDGGPPSEIGGVLTMSGDREGSFEFDRESIQDRYTISGPDGRVFFGNGHPAELEQITIDGWDFYIHEGDCELTPGERNDETGVAGLHIRCVDLGELRDKGVASIEGTLGVAASVLGLRGDLPESGGTMQLGDMTLTFDGAFLSTAPTAFGGPYAGTWYDQTHGVIVSFSWDPDTHALSLSEVQYQNDIAPLSPGACSIAERDLGLLSPHARVVEMTIGCASVDLPSLGSVPLEGTVIVEVVTTPD